MSSKEHAQSYVAVTLLLIKDGKILMSKRLNAKYGNGEYGLVGGHIDGNESATSALVREAHEEVGITINPEDLRSVHVQHLKIDHPDLPSREYVNLFFTTDKWEGTPTIMEPHKSEDLGWISLTELPENMGKSIRYALEQYLQGSFYSEFGWSNN